MRGRDAARSAVWLMVGVACAAPVPAFFSIPIPLPVTLGIAAVAGVAIWRTEDALLILAALVPMAGAVHGLSGAPYDPTALLEVAVLTVLSGAALRAAIRRARLPGTPFELAVLTFICLALASCVALLPTALLRAEASDWRSELSELLFRDYFRRRAPFVSVKGAALLVEGSALAAVVAHVIKDAQQARRLSAMIVWGGAAAAALNVYRLLEVSMRRPPFVETLVDVLQSVRFNTQYGDLNAAGSYFAMVTILAGWNAGFRSTAARMHASALPLLGCALWVTGSRVALATALLCTAAAPVLRHSGPLFRRFSLRARLVAATGALLLAFGLLIVLLSTARHGSIPFSIATRLELLKTSARMLADRPLLGVGVSQYYARFPQFVSPELERAFADAVGRPVPRENAHNQFAQVLAELGIAGLVSFTLVLALALATLRRQPPESWRLAVVVALAGFLLTSLAGHPLLTPVVAFSFWIIVGLAAAASTPPRTSRLLASTVTVMAVLLLATLPWRWSLERREANLAGVTMGLSRWRQDPDGTRFRSAAGRATVFVRSEAAAVSIPLRSPDQVPRRVRILLDGQLAEIAIARPEVWSAARLWLPRERGAAAYLRIDLEVDPSSTAADSSDAPVNLMVGPVVE